MRLLPGGVRLDPRTRMPYTDPRALPGLWTPKQTHTWERAAFTVPDDVSEERVQDSAHKYRLRFGNALELQGYEVLAMGMPERDETVLARGTTDPDRRRYVIWAKVRRRPVEVKVDVPDEDIALYEKAGFRHA
jgi:hypothetical protein